MPTLIEGYTSADAVEEVPEQVAHLTSWLGPLRSEARAAMVRRMVLERIQNGGYSGYPESKKMEVEWGRIVEAFVIGTAIAITSQFVYKWLNKKFKGKVT